MAKTKEVVLTDNHGNLEVYNTLETILSSEQVDRVFHCGDFREGFNKEQIASVQQALMQNPETANLLQNFSIGEENLKMLVQQNYGRDMNAFFSAIMSGQANENEKNLYTNVAQLNERVFDLIFGNASAIEYSPQNEIIGNLKNKYNINFYGVHGNHDNAFLHKIMTNVDWLIESQSLENEGAIGASAALDGLITETGEVVGNPQWQGPDAKYLIPADDDYVDINKSEVYKKHKGKNINLIVSHHSRNIAVKGPHGLGLLQLEKENSGLINYCGHLHGGMIYRDPETLKLYMNPGQKNIFHVTREGKEVSEVKVFKL